MFRNTIDAFLYLLDGREQENHLQGKHRVASISVDVDYLANGIKRCGVQVMFDDGAGYGLEAYDKEADELYNIARARSYAPEAPYLTAT